MTILNHRLRFDSLVKVLNSIQQTYSLNCLETKHVLETFKSVYYIQLPISFFDSFPFLQDSTKCRSQMSNTFLCTCICNIKKEVHCKMKRLLNSLHTPPFLHVSCWIKRVGFIRK